jgi:hypothetical protein
MAASIVYVVLGGLQCFDGSAGDSPPEDVDLVGLWLNVSYATVSPGNKAGVMGTAVVPFNYGDDDVAIEEAIGSVVADAVKQKTGVAPRVRIIGRQE